MKNLIFCTVTPILIFLFFSFSVTAQTSDLPKEIVKRVEKQVTDLLLKPELKNGKCEIIDNFQNWEKIKLDKCEYSRKKDNTGFTKRAIIVVHIPTATQLARWIVNTCIIVKGSASTKCTDGLVSKITEQSGGQFPVAGIVYEDMDRDGFENTWNFRDGVTVVVENGIGNDSQKQPTDPQIEASLFSKVLRTGKYGYARITGTTREQYISSCKMDNNCLPDAKIIGSTSERKPEWLGVVRRLYQAALKSDKNELMIAWARNNSTNL